MIHIQSRCTEGREGGGGFLATKVCVVRESSSQGANGVRENKGLLSLDSLDSNVWKWCLSATLEASSGCKAWRAVEVSSQESV